MPLVGRWLRPIGQPKAILKPGTSQEAARRPLVFRLFSANTPLVLRWFTGGNRCDATAWPPDPWFRLSALVCRPFRLKRTFSWISSTCARASSSGLSRSLRFCALPFPAQAFRLNPIRRLPPGARRKGGECQAAPLANSAQVQARTSRSLARLRLCAKFLLFF
jgi:hypothetical protein